MVLSSLPGTPLLNTGFAFSTLSQRYTFTPSISLFSMSSCVVSFFTPSSAEVKVTDSELKLLKNLPLYPTTTRLTLSLEPSYSDPVLTLHDAVTTVASVISSTSSKEVSDTSFS